MFMRCSGLTNLTELSNWVTSSVTNMSSMFYECTGLTDLTGISNWTTSSVTNMSGMFYECTGIIDATAINNWDISKVTNFTRIFYNVPLYPDWPGTWDSYGTYTPATTQTSSLNLNQTTTSQTTNTQTMSLLTNDIEEPTQQTTPTIQIGTTTYPTLAEAIASANNQDTLKLLQDITLTETLTIPKEKNITIDLNTKTITSTSINTITNNGTLTITGTGIIRNEVENGNVIYNTGTLNIANGVITTATNGGKAVYNDAGTINMSAGKIVTEGIGGIGVYNINNGKVVLESGIIEVTGASSKCIYNDSELEINGGNIVVSGDDSIGIYNSDKATKCVMKDVEILIEAEVIENYDQIKNTDEFKAELEEMKSSYGIYNNSSVNVEIQTATITVERLKGVGVMNCLDGLITLGVEDTEVSLATPIVYAISDYTTAIVNGEDGEICFFDGKLCTLVSVKDVITKVLDSYELVEEIGELVLNTTLRLIEVIEDIEATGDSEDIEVTENIDNIENIENEVEEENIE